MIHIEINEVIYNLPESWEEVTLDQFVRILKKGTELKESEMLGILAGVPVDVIRQTDSNDILQSMNLLSWTYQSLPDSKSVSEFEFEGIKYTVPENLGDVTFGEWEDINAYERKIQDNQWESLSFMIAILCREENQIYEPRLVEEMAERFKQLPVTIAYGIGQFFFVNAKKYSDNLQASLDKIMTLIQSEPVSKLLEKNGEDISRLKVLLKKNGSLKEFMDTKTK